MNYRKTHLQTIWFNFHLMCVSNLYMLIVAEHKTGHTGDCPPSFRFYINLLLGITRFSSGTRIRESTEKLGKSSTGRSPKRVCYVKLLRSGADHSAQKSRETVRNGPRSCYGFSPGLLPKGMLMRGGQFYLRRHIPSDIQAII